jgi:hypothetical protein
MGCCKKAALLVGYVGAVDGLFQKTTEPKVKEVGNVISYFQLIISLMV